MQLSNPFRGHFLVLFTSETNQIENIDVSYNTTRELFETGRLTNYTGDLRAAMAVANNQAVAEYLNQQLDLKAPITPGLIKEIHRLLMHASMDNHRYHDNGERAGTYKVKDYEVGRLSVSTPPEFVPAAIEELCTTITDGCAQHKDPYKLAAALLCHFENIHPFADGNGRVGRWLVNYLLVLCGQYPIVFYNEDKHELFSALEIFDAIEEYSAMWLYLLGQAEKSKKATRELN